MADKIFKKIYRHIKYIVLIGKMSYMSSLEYRTSHYLRFVRILLEMGLTTFTINIIFSKTQNIGNWNRSEVFLVFAVWSLAIAVIYFFISNSTYQTSRDIRKGAIDPWLLKPMDSQFILTFRNLHIDNIFRICGALIILVYAFNQLGFVPSLDRWLMFLAQFVAVQTIWYSMMFLAVTISFLTQGSEQLAIVDNLTVTARYPLDLFGRKLTLVLATILPLIYLSTVPAKTLLNKSSGILSWMIFIIAILFFLATRKLWIWSLGKYTSVSS